MFKLTQCTMKTLLCPLCTVHCALHTLHSTKMLCYQHLPKVNTSFEVALWDTSTHDVLDWSLHLTFSYNGLVVVFNSFIFITSLFHTYHPPWLNIFFPIPHHA